LFLLSVLHHYTIEMVQLVLETSGFQTYHLIFRPITAVILITHRYGIGSFYYTLFSWKTQASFGEFGQHIAPESYLWIETHPFSAMYRHHEYPFRDPDLGSSQSDAVIVFHEFQHLSGEFLGLEIAALEHPRFGQIMQHTSREFHAIIYWPEFSVIFL